MILHVILMFTLCCVYCQDIAKWSLMCASEMIEHRANSWELYGFDFMVDDEHNAWLIEINSSPACDYSTKVTERYVQKALVELLSVVLDVREWEETPKKTRGAKPDTGGWECIYQGPLLDMPVGAFGTDMSLKGEGYKSLPPRRAIVPPTNHQGDFGGGSGPSPKGGGEGSNFSSTAVSGSARHGGSLLPRPPPGANSSSGRSNNTATRYSPTENSGIAAAGGGASGGNRGGPGGGTSSRIPQRVVPVNNKDQANSSAVDAPGGVDLAEGSGDVGFDDSDGDEGGDDNAKTTSPGGLGRGHHNRAAAARENRSKATATAGVSSKPHTVSATGGGGGSSVNTAAIPIKVFTVDF